MTAGNRFDDDIAARLSGLRDDGLYKTERVITSKQAGVIEVGGEKTINLCANNYLGLADNAELIATAQAALDRYGYGMASVRFICGTQEEHTQLEARIAGFLGMEDAILYAACFDANTGLFETILDANDAIISDALNHASIIDGVRLCKAQRLRYANSDMDDLEEKLKAAEGARHRLIATDGVFSMDGYIARLPEICDLAEAYDAMVMVDDSHAVGFMGGKRARHAGTLRRGGPGGYHHRHAGQGAGGCLGWLYGGKRSGGGLAAPALAPVPVFQHAGPGDRGDLAESF